MEVNKNSDVHGTHWTANILCVRRKNRLVMVHNELFANPVLITRISCLRTKCSQVYMQLYRWHLKDAIRVWHMPELWVLQNLTELWNFPTISHSLFSDLSYNFYNKFFKHQMYTYNFFFSLCSKFSPNFSVHQIFIQFLQNIFHISCTINSAGVELNSYHCHSTF